MADYEEDNFKVEINDSGVPSGGRFVAKVTETLDGATDRFIIRYAYGLTKIEAIENAKKLIKEIKK